MLSGAGCWEVLLIVYPAHHDSVVLDLLLTASHYVITTLPVDYVNCMCLLSLCYSTGWPWFFIQTPLGCCLVPAEQQFEGSLCPTLLSQGTWGTKHCVHNMHTNQGRMLTTLSVLTFTRTVKLMSN